MASSTPPFPPPRAAYVHIPFCVHRCGYCDFTVVAGRDDLIDSYLQAIELELGGLGRPRPVESLFIGGGTPTHLNADQLGRLLDCVTRWFPIRADDEFSVEANPADLDEDRLDVLAQFGVNRLSLGAQSFDDAKLRLLERDHRADDVVAAFRLARSRFPSVSLDLIFACPGESLDVWSADLESALALQPDHVSSYGLTFERGTAFWGRRLKGQLQEVDEELQRAMFALAIDRLTAEGFEHYEVSNFARPGHRSRHNEVYWAAESYYAVGPGASRYVDGRRETNHRSTFTWLRRILAGKSPVADWETLSPEDRAREALVLGLRRMRGVDVIQFAKRTGFDLHDLVGPALKRCCESELLREMNGRIALTREGLFVSDSIWSMFLSR